MPPITPYALKYGVANYEDQPLLCDSNSSGLAPRTRIPRSRIEYFLEMALEKDQRDQLKGLTTQELIDLGAHARMGVQPSNLRGAIHPILERNTQWVSTLGSHEIGNKWGVWDVGNDYLWKALEPCLLLATRLIDSSYLQPWFKALLFGNLVPIADHRFASGNNVGDPNLFVSFHNVQQDISASAMSSKWLDFKRHVKFAFAIKLRTDAVRARTIGSATPNSPHHPPSFGILGPQDSRIELNIRILLPLLYALDPGERLITQYAVAKTVVHELCHALGKYRLVDVPLNPNSKPGNRKITMKMERFFYEDEDQMELGYSFENAVFGGAQSFYAPKDDYGHDEKRLDLPFPPMAVTLASWPNFHRLNDKNNGGSFVTDIKVPNLLEKMFTNRSISVLHTPVHLAFIEDMRKCCGVFYLRFQDLFHLYYP